MIGMMMKIFPNDTVKMLQFPGLGGDCNISHFITTRYGGVSTGNYASFNPGAYSGDDSICIRTNREILSDAIGISSEKIFTPFQVHGAEVRALTSSFLSLTTAEQEKYIYGADALVTDIPGVCIAVATADCVPVLLYAPDKKVVAVVHAGWRGTVQYIVEKTVRFIVGRYKANPALIQAGIGPSICKDAFEVGEEVVEAFRNAGMDLSLIMERDETTGKAHIDLWEANRNQLLVAGVLSGNVEMAGICTYSQCDDFFSARRLGINSGRILSGIVILEN